MLGENSEKSVGKAQLNGAIKVECGVFIVTRLMISYRAKEAKIYL